jgi:hypothetical protein
VSKTQTRLTPTSQLLRHSPIATILSVPHLRLRVIKSTRPLTFPRHSESSLPGLPRCFCAPSSFPTAVISHHRISDPTHWTRFWTLYRYILPASLSLSPTSQLSSLDTTGTSTTQCISSVPHSLLTLALPFPHPLAIHPSSPAGDVMIAKEREARSRSVTKERGGGYVEGKVS